MRKDKLSKLFSHEAIIPRMSWSAHNLYNLIARSTIPMHIAGTDFSRTAMTMNQQRWRAKRFLRGYHGDWIPERRFKRWFLPVDLPKLASSVSPNAASSTLSAERLPSRPAPFFSPGSGRRGQRDEDSERSQMPTASLFVTDVERRLDVVVFRCNFARSVYEARNMVIHGKVKLNGHKMSDPNRLLNPGDLISVNPDAIPMLSKQLEERERRRKEEIEAASAAAAAAEKELDADQEGEATKAEEDGAVAAKEGDDAAASETEASAEAFAEAGDAAKDGKEAAGVEDSASAEAGGEAGSSPDADAAKTSTEMGEENGKEASSSSKTAKTLPPGVRPFTLPAFAAPFLFVPSYLETSYNTCSAIYLRHPTIVPAPPSQLQGQQQRQQRYGGSASPSTPEFLSEIPSPYPASGDIFSMAWEHYARTAPRIRGDLRRLQLKARVGVSNGSVGARAKGEVGAMRAGGEEVGGFEQERAKVVWRRMRAVKRGWARVQPVAAGGAPGTPRLGGEVSSIRRA